MVSADFVKRNSIPISKDESVLGDVRKTNQYQVDGYFIASWKVQGVHDAHPGIFAVVVKSQALPQNVEVLLEPVKNGVYERNSAGESTSHMLSWQSGE